MPDRFIEVQPTGTKSVTCRTFLLTGRVVNDRDQSQEVFRVPDGIEIALSLPGLNAQAHRDVLDAIVDEYIERRRGAR